MKTSNNKQSGWIWLGLPLGLGSLMVALVIWLASSGAAIVSADPIDPPDGYPKFTTSIKTVSPTLASTAGETLTYEIEIQNTGAYTAFGTILTDVLPAEATINGQPWSSAPPAPAVNGQTISWNGDVGFDASVTIIYSVTVAAGYSGTLENSAVIEHSLIAEPVHLSAEAVITDDPILKISKTSTPPLPGADKPLTYTLTVINTGNEATSLPISVTDQVPSDTEYLDVGPDGSQNGGLVTWEREVSLDTGESTDFYFSVTVDDALSGTIITNDSYQVSSDLTSITYGDPYTTTVVDPVLRIWKEAWPDPPGANREMTYKLTLLNSGSLATDLVITDTVPAGVTYERGGSESGGVVTWNLPELDTDEIANFTFTVSISDVIGAEIVNADYGACSEEGICVAGSPLVNIVDGPNFEVFAEVYPIAKKPGGGTEVTPTLTVKNLGPGNALSATAVLEFFRISVSLSDLLVIPSRGEFTALDCGDKCKSYLWEGDIAHGETITFTTDEGQSSIGGNEGEVFYARLSISDTLGVSATQSFSDTAYGRITHFANLLPTKSAPPEIGADQLLTYTIKVWNTGLSTEVPPSPLLTETVPLSTSLVQASDDAISQTVNGRTILTWTLPALSTGDTLYRTFVVRTDPDLVSGTQIVNSDYGTKWYETRIDGYLSLAGEPVTTTIRDVGLIDSYKEVTPTLSAPGPDNTLTYTVYIVNSSPHNLSGVTLYDFLPWEDSTYNRDAIATSGQVISDIVSVEWSGDVAPYSSEQITLTVLVDPEFEGDITNTAVISHTSLNEPVIIDAVAYVTNAPVLQISKSASPDEVNAGDEILYTIHVVNSGQRATGLTVVDELPANATYVIASGSPSPVDTGSQLAWEFPLLEPHESQQATFRVTADSGRSVVNDKYYVESIEGGITYGGPVTTPIVSGGFRVYIPVVMR